MKKSVSMIIATLAFQVNTAVAQGPLDIFRSNSTKTRLEKNELFLYESEPGTAVTHLKETAEGMTFTAWG